MTSAKCGFCELCEDLKPLDYKDWLLLQRHIEDRHPEKADRRDRGYSFANV